MMELPEKDRLELARRIVTSVAAEEETRGAIDQALRGIEDVVTGKVRGLSEGGFRDALR